MEVIADRLALPRFAWPHLPAFVRAAMPPLGPRSGAGNRRALHRYAAETAPYVPPCAPSTGKSVAIVGAGPAGLAAATIWRGTVHACTLFDAHALPGGMLRYGIPANRLPKDALDSEIDIIRQLGAQFRMGQRWGEHFTLAGLRQQHDAVFVAIGAQPRPGAWLRRRGARPRRVSNFWSA